MHSENLQFIQINKSSKNLGMKTEAMCAGHKFMGEGVTPRLQHSAKYTTALDGCNSIDVQ